MRISKPTLILDEEQAKSNIKKMADKAKKHNLRFRPHFKTHQSADIGEWFKAAGVNSITVSSVSMACYFAKYGWQDITIAFPYNPLEFNEIDELASRGVKLNVLIENQESIDFINKDSNAFLGAYIKIDTGNCRTGVPADDIHSIKKLVDSINTSKKIDFKGFLTHSGHTYNAANKSEIIEIHKASLNQMYYLKERFGGGISIGDTPSCSIAEEFSGVNEIRPGNFVFYDLMQYQLGSCSLNKIAVVVACPIVAKHTERSEIVVYGGAIHFSKEYIFINGIKIYGQPVWFNAEKSFSADYGSRSFDFSIGEKMSIIESSYLKYLSQEHGIIKASEEYFNRAKIGELAYIVPVHSCLTANLLKEYMLSDGRTVKMMNL